MVSFIEVYTLTIAQKKKKSNKGRSQGKESEKDPLKDNWSPISTLNLY